MEWMLQHKRLKFICDIYYCIVMNVCLDKSFWVWCMSNLSFWSRVMQYPARLKWLNYATIIKKTKSLSISGIFQLSFWFKICCLNFHNDWGLWITSHLMFFPDLWNSSPMFLNCVEICLGCCRLHWGHSFKLWIILILAITDCYSVFRCRNGNL